MERALLIIINSRYLRHRMCPELESGMKSVYRDLQHSICQFLAHCYHSYQYSCRYSTLQMIRFIHASNRIKSPRYCISKKGTYSINQPYPQISISGP